MGSFTVGCLVRRWWPTYGYGSVNMRKPESEVEKTQQPATGAMCDYESMYDQSKVEEEARMILMHGQMGPSDMEMEDDD